MSARESLRTDRFFAQYVDTALWSTNDNADPETGGEPLDSNYDASDIQDATLERMKADCDRFRAKRADILARAYAHPDVSYNEENAGHDLWLTRNGHGTGFWDRGLGDVGKRLTEAARNFGEVNLFVGDDGTIDDGRVAP